MLGNKVFILGAGFIGKPLALQLKEKGYTVEVSVRDADKVADLNSMEIPIHAFSVGDDSVKKPPFECDILVICYPIGSRSNPRGSHLKQAEWLAKYFPTHGLKQVILTSSTSVYPDGLGLVDESCMQRPAAHGLIQLEYEEAVQKIYGEKLTIFRLAGLVGDNRQPGRFLAGKTDLPNAQSPVNMVQQVDVLRFVIACILRELKGEVFNLCHDDHPTRENYYSTAALALDMSPPTFSSQQIERPKVVDNTKSKHFFQMEYIASIS